jgi:hypothetical protein
MKIPKFIVLVLLYVFLSAPSDAQSFYSYRRDRDFLVSLGVGTSQYFGEMVNPGEFGQVKPNIVVGAEYFLTNRISARGELTWFQLAGDDRDANDDRRERNLHFKSSNLEFNVTGVVYLSPQGVRFYQRSKLNFYGFAGIGVLYFNPKADYQGTTYALQPLKTEGVSYSRVQPVIPFGLGVRIKVDPFFNIMIEGGYRKTFTDYLDDASSARYPGYPDANPITDPIAKALSDRRQEYQDEFGNGRVVSTASGRRGNPNKKDNYMMVNVKVQYYLPYQVFNKGPNRKLYRSKRKGYYQRRR